MVSVPCDRRLPVHWTLLHLSSLIPLHCHQILSESSLPTASPPSSAIDANVKAEIAEDWATWTDAFRSVLNSVSHRITTLDELLFAADAKSTDERVAVTAVAIALEPTAFQPFPGHSSLIDSNGIVFICAQPGGKDAALQVIGFIRVMRCQLLFPQTVLHLG